MAVDTGNGSIATAIKHIPSVVDVRKLITPADRETVVYVGRQCAGWRGSPFQNPHKRQYRTRGVRQPEAKTNPVSLYFDTFHKRPDLDTALAELWELTEHGRKPLGCWCLKERWFVPPDAELLKVNELECHAQIIAIELYMRFLHDII